MSAADDKTSVSSAQREFFRGFRDSIPLIIGAIPFAIIFGGLAESNGLSFSGALAMSLIVFAGSAQFIALGMLGLSVAWPIIVFTTFVVNLRHLLYAASLLLHVKNLGQRWRVPMAFWLTDETFAVVINRYHQSGMTLSQPWYYLGSAVSMYVNWVTCTFVGLTIGRTFPYIEDWGLEFAMPVTFIGMVIPYLKTRPMWAATIVSGVVAVLTYGFPHKLGLVLSALIGIGTGFVLDLMQARKSI